MALWWPCRSGQASRPGEEPELEPDDNGGGTPGGTDPDEGGTDLGD